MEQGGGGSCKVKVGKFQRRGRKGVKEIEEEEGRQREADPVELVLRRAAAWRGGGRDGRGAAGAGRGMAGGGRSSGWRRHGQARVTAAGTRGSGRRGWDGTGAERSWAAGSERGLHAAAVGVDGHGGSLLQRDRVSESRVRVRATLRSLFSLVHAIAIAILCSMYCFAACCLLQE